MNIFTLLPLLARAADAFRTGHELLAILREIFIALRGNVPAEVESMFGPAIVRWVQSSLNRLGHGKLDVDGEYGELTKAAVRKFQTTHGLDVDGWAGPKTRAALQAALM